MSKIILTTGPDKGALWHNGNLLNEGRLIASGQAWANYSHYAILRVAGSDRLTWLNDLTTQLTLDLTDIFRRAFILNAQGHIRFDFALADDGNSTWIVTEKEKAAELLSFLEKMKFMLDLAIADESENYGAISQGANGLIAGQSLTNFQIVPRANLPKIIGALDPLAEVGFWSLEADRISRKIPRIILDGDERTIPNELVNQLYLPTANLPNRELPSNDNFFLQAVHLKKGCYPGQETVAKTYNLGAPPRLLTLIHLDGSEVDLPEVGSPVEFAGSAIGRVGSSARHFELGNIALALIKRSFVEKNSHASLLVGGVAASMEL
jgi:tRNA-modifying protein YgfZ